MPPEQSFMANSVYAIKSIIFELLRAGLTLAFSFIALASFPLAPITRYKIIRLWSWILIKVSIYSQNNSRVITTGVPFLLISPDARSAGMGELGVATSPDVFSQQWNPSKYVFSEKGKEIGLSYTPYLSKLVNDIFLANITYFLKKNDRSAWGFSLKYFSLGDIQFNDLIGNTIVQQGIERDGLHKGR